MDLRKFCKNYFLFGPRGTGKSTCLKNYYLNPIFINLLKPDILRQYLSKPERLTEIVKRSMAKTIMLYKGEEKILIDKIQIIPIYELLISLDTSSNNIF